jgi:hypothetical protein
VNTPSSGYVPPYRRATIKGYFPADRSSRAPSVANSCVEIAEPTHLGKLMPGDLEPTYGRSHDEKMTVKLMCVGEHVWCVCILKSQTEICVPTAKLFCEVFGKFLPSHNTTQKN